VTVAATMTTTAATTAAVQTATSQTMTICLTSLTTVAAAMTTMTTRTSTVTMDAHAELVRSRAWCRVEDASLLAWPDLQWAPSASASASLVASLAASPTAVVSSLLLPPSRQLVPRSWCHG
jgi:hypothetical protein